MCAEQEIALRGHREQYSSNFAGKNSNTERTMQRGNVLAIINAFATLDTVIMEHLKKCAENAKILSWQIENDNWMFIWVCTVKNKGWDSRLERNYWRWCH